MGTDEVEVYGTVLRETEDALLVDFADGEIWLPKSQLEDWPDVGEEGDIVMMEWLAVHNDLV